jgi:signal transduction histidine kinase
MQHNTNFFVFYYNFTWFRFVPIITVVLKVIFLNSIFLLAHIYSCAQVILGQSDNYNLEEQVSFLKDSTNQCTKEKVYQLLIEKKLEKANVAENRINLGVVYNDYWLAYQIHNPTKIIKKLEAGFLNGSVYRLDAYIFNENGICYDSFRVSKFWPYQQRPIDSRHLYFPVQIPPGKTHSLTFKFDTKGNSFQFPMVLVTPAWRINNDSQMGNHYAFVSGAFMLLCFLSFIWWIWSRERLYFYYFTYVLGYALLYLCDGEFDFKWLYPNWPSWATISTSMYGCLLVITMLLFMDKFLELKVTRKKLHTITISLILFVATLLILIPIGYVFSENLIARRFITYWGFVLVIAGWLWPIYCIYVRLKDGFKMAIIYAIAFTGVLFSAALYLLNSIGVMHSKLLPPQYWLLGIGFEIVVLFVALAINYNRIRTKSKELETSLVNEKIEHGKQLILTLEAEQKRIAQDLHDEMGGNLAAIKITLQSFDLEHEQLQTMEQLIDNASNNARSIAHNLMPPEFENTKFDELLKNYFNRLNAEGKVNFNFHSSGPYNYFTKTEELMLYRVILELVNNIIKHAQATEATIQLVYYEHYLELMAEDNGKWFSEKNTAGIGLKNIQSRIDYLNGKITFDSSQHGTTVIIQIPFKAPTA